MNRGRGEGPVPTTPASMAKTTTVDTELHVDFPAPERAPDEVMRELRRIDPRADLVYFGQGRWILGATSPNDHRQGKGRAMLKAVRAVSVGDQSQRALDRRRLASLFAQGFRTIQMYRFEEGGGRHFDRIIQDFKVRDRNYRVAFGDHLEEAERQIDGRAHEQKAIDTLLESARAKTEDIKKFVFRKATSLVQEEDVTFTDDGEDPDG